MCFASGLTLRFIEFVIALATLSVSAVLYICTIYTFTMIKQIHIVWVNHFKTYLVNNSVFNPFLNLS